MSGLYPSLEDMKVGQMARAQVQHQQVAHQAAIEHNQHSHVAAPGYPPQPGPPSYAPVSSAGQSSLYPSLEEYMGLNLTPEFVAQNMPLVAQQPQAQAVAVPQSSGMLAPVTGNSVGLRRAEVKSGVRELICCKDEQGRIGLRVRSISKGVFVQFVHKNTPAALAGLRFGDQILQINGENVAGWDTDKTMKYLKKCDPQRIVFAVRDRPFERTITLQKDSSGHVGFVYKNGEVTKIAKESSAARNGLLIDHMLVEVNGQNVIGLKDSEISEIVSVCGRTVTLTIIPNFIYKHIMKSIGGSLVKKDMDHSIPDV
ncbi:syntenin-1-like [Saccoglossus kowalevskii]|uniref:Syntenin-1-like n=1 Tax=Saccoglossus kowalevskii TaxID=10224 RepID=A0ABM0H1C2_SACKO|nr:PREDICTED: syntenin-1-like [Saccoglossus kowalevskii]